MNTVAEAPQNGKEFALVKKYTVLNKRKPLQPQNHTCPICDKKLNIAISQHVRRRHKNNCQLCYKNFDTKEEVSSHVLSEHGGKKREPYISCAICNNDWKTAWKMSFNNHIKTVHKDSLCCKGQSSKSNKYCHILEEHANFHCLLCENKLQKYRDLKAHMDSEHEMPYDCATHHLFFTSEFELEMHKKVDKTHIRPKPPTKFFICHICAKKYKRREIIFRHNQKGIEAIDELRQKLLNKI